MRNNIYLFMLIISQISIAEIPIYIPDDNLKMVLETQLGTSHPTASDMLTIIGLQAGSRDIRDLTGLEYALNIKELYLQHNHWIRDISALSGLIQLERLDLSQNNIIDISALSGMIHLQHLNIHENSINDISPLYSLINLQELIIRYNYINDISFLSELQNLQELDLKNNHIFDISPLLILHSLQDLDIRQNPLNREACEVYIPQMFQTYPGIAIKRNDCINKYTLKISSASGGSVIDPGEGSFSKAIGLRVRLEARADPGYEFVGFSGTNGSSTSNPLYITMDRYHEIKAIFSYSMQVIYVDDNGINDPGPLDINVSDPNENGTPQHPFDSIQEAILSAPLGATIYVQDGLYREHISFLGKALTVTGFDPYDMNAISTYPEINGQHIDPIVTFNHQENNQALLQGFKLTQSDNSSAGIIHISGSHPTITHCLMVGNRSLDPYGCVIHCIDSNAILLNCTISGNYCGEGGAAIFMHHSNTVIKNTILWGNEPLNIDFSNTSHPTIEHCNMVEYWLGINTIHTDPMFIQYGYWADINDINLVVAPYESNAVWITGDYHLQSEQGRWDPMLQAWVQDSSTSPGIDAGDVNSSWSLEPLPNGERINIGVYGGTRQASMSPLPMND